MSLALPLPYAYWITYCMHGSSPPLSIASRARHLFLHLHH